MIDLALVSATDFASKDEDMAPLQAAAADAGLSCAVWCWDDPSVDWSACRLALLRSPWDYIERYVEFIAWLASAEAQCQLLNPADLVRWNTDKRYLLELAQAGAPVIQTLAIAPGGALRRPDSAEFVIKPAVGNGSRGARRFGANEEEAAATHLQALHDQGHTALVQPYLERVDVGGETALLYFDGEFSHAIRKNALLRRKQDAGNTLTEEAISAREPNADQRAVGDKVLAALARLKPQSHPPLYARVDLLDDPQGQPQLLELELAEPSLFFSHAPGSAARLIECVRLRVEGPGPRA